MGTSGCVVNSELKRVLFELSKQHKYQQRVNYIMNILPSTMADNRMNPLKIPNILYNLEDKRTEKMKEIYSKSHISLADAGLDFHIPIPALLRKERELDIILILDISSEMDNAKNLKSAQQYAKQHLLPFPEINCSKLDDKLIRYKI